MKRADISKVVGGISTRHIQEAAYDLADIKVENCKKKTRYKAVAAAVLVFCFLAAGLRIYVVSQDAGIKAYAYGTDDEITKAGAVLQTGTISNDGEMKGCPLMFYLTGKGIESVRFSCKNQQLQFRDWTQKRDEFGLSQNFTVPYGEQEDDYGYLTIDWEPNDTIEALMENEQGTIQDLPQALREDLIVLQVTFINKKTAVKAISISLLNDGTFFAKLTDYQISDADTFVNRTDALSLRELSQIKQAEIEKEESEKSAQDKKKEKKTQADSIVSAAMEAAKAYYAETVIEVVSMDVINIEIPSNETPSNETLTTKKPDQKKAKITFSVCASIDGIIQEPNRTITLKQKQGMWEVVKEGY